jgi:Domain of unknown function (DUF2382)
VRRYVAERPVQQDVTLRGERVTIERRRPIDTTGAPGRAFEERVVEVHETEEVPIVAKTARVVEEVAIRKELGLTAARAQKLGMTGRKPSRLGASGGGGQHGLLPQKLGFAGDLKRLTLRMADRA